LALDEEVVVAALQAEFDMDMLTSYLPVTFDKLSLITKNAVLPQTMKKFIKSNWLDLRFLHQHADLSQLEGFY